MYKFYRVRLTIVIKDVNVATISWRMITTPLKTFKLHSNLKAALHAIAICDTWKGANILEKQGKEKIN